MPKSQSEMIYDLYSSGVLCFSVIELIKVYSMVPQGPSVSEAQMSWGTIQSSILGPNSSLSSAAEVGELCVCVCTENVLCHSIFGATGSCPTV